ncbi:hypothetical protein DKT77_13545 [Meridianimarinicoccus roseus]|uniref:Uncharacterized protein n=2 Tax=Meridianimarinicoccus roseus TaxID=2072018 RepID=A0A2V2LF26_9RHOB|nr:hypothetical protein DKT77_13545 [Meridianimarinicoccus roseus]
MPEFPKLKAQPHGLKRAVLLPMAERSDKLLLVDWAGEWRAIEGADPGRGVWAHITPKLWCVIESLPTFENAAANRHS